MSATERLTVDLGARSYEIAIGAGLLQRAGDELRKVLRQPRAIVVTDRHLAATAHLATLEASLQAAAIEFRTLVVPAGESSKSLAELDRHPLRRAHRASPTGSAASAASTSATTAPTGPLPLSMITSA